MSDDFQDLLDHPEDLAAVLLTVALIFALIVIVGCVA